MGTNKSDIIVEQKNAIRKKKQHRSFYNLWNSSDNILLVAEFVIALSGLIFFPNRLKTILVILAALLLVWLIGSVIIDINDFLFLKKMEGIIINQNTEFKDKEKENTSSDSPIKNQLPCGLFKKGNKN